MLFTFEFNAVAVIVIITAVVPEEWRKIMHKRADTQ